MTVLREKEKRVGGVVHDGGARQGDGEAETAGKNAECDADRH